MSTKSNRMFILLLVAMLLVVQPESGAFSDGPLDVFAPTPSAAAELRSIIFPVAGQSDYADTFGACRDGCTRSHQGVDIFAPKLTPVVAVVDGTIVSERRNATGKPGNKVVIEDADGWRYSYFHLNNDAPGTDDDSNPQSWIIASNLRAGDRVQAGQIVGYVGDSGNAEETPPHLHFEIRPPDRPTINPTPSVTAARGRGEVVTAETYAVDDDEAEQWIDLVVGRYEELADRAPTEAELGEWTARLALGLGTEADLVGDLAMGAAHREPEGAALRAFVATFSRLPTEGALDTLAGIYRAGGTVDELAERIVGSVDYGALGSDLDAVTIAELTSSDDIKRETWHLLQIVRAYRAAAGRLPDGDEIEAWTRHLDSEGLQVDVVAGALDDELPAGPPLRAGEFSPVELGYAPGLNVRQGPIDLDPTNVDGRADEPTFAAGRRSSTGTSNVDFELVVEEGSDGSDTANLVVKIPLDELAAAQGGDAELTVELRLTQPADPNAEADAEATVDLVLGEGDGDPTTQPTVRTPTTRPPTTRPPTARRATTTTTRPAPTSPATTTTTAATTTATTTTTAAPTTTTCASTTVPSTTTPPTTAPSTTVPSTTAPSSTTPSTTAPSTTAPSTTAPSTTAPSTTAPSTTAPGSDPTPCPDPDVSTAVTTTTIASTTTTVSTTAEQATSAATTP